MQISNTGVYSKPDPGICQQQHVPTPSGPTSTDMAIKNSAVCENTELLQHDFITTGLFYEHRHDVVKFSNVLGIPQEIQSKNDDYAAVVYDKKWQALLLQMLMLLAIAKVPPVAVCNFTDQWMILLTRTQCRSVFQPVSDLQN